MLQTLYFVRHTETILSGKLLGQTDPPLTEQSQNQLLKTLHSLPKPKRVLSSPRQRCQLVAKAFSEKLDAEFTVVNALQEMNFGDWDGKSYEWLWQHTRSPSIGDFWQNPWAVTPPEGESMACFNARIKAWWCAFTSQSSDDTIVIVTHGGVMKQLLAHWLALPEGAVNHLNCFEVGYGKVIQVSVFYDEQGSAWPKVVF
ncbi:histidine phosphatase family protein [Pseudoalteromonas luteoviolacea]|uniref:Phosphoglycerate mutase n=1 Tax=Pseudoalteromonas luteoviolacea S4054 TaxID=1129367 RepID=A0A0F6AGI7_9GAMM|nr:histidine phosphatase family protein [Pseudoalteromonas luteoviolacea]AOT07258.1 hypothetical protein S4054249_05025 [Pseudoalteromonas luteoviolacea]AOT12173.1 hypothetical protein S40542_05025 [Pseudoalteromonas luteoviolacea]AOT17086.1 hypothetical protein S4054_05025 [Pseudoalteromonas luteoviolacea]KKE85312.1 hypothetical protein N479_04750 [Pseudoalteromonas luteoviolacea S4054]KZN73660.1 hypothetical protein N481_11160 [Pseudoalteromonas luteoviolacea S4047-1]